VDIDNTNGNVKLTSVTASDNDYDGIEIENVDGSLNLYCVTTSNNGADGIYIDVDHDFTIKCSQTTNNLDDGLEIVNAPTAQLLSLTTFGNTNLDINNQAGAALTIRDVDCSKKKSPSTSISTWKKNPYTKLYCLPGEIQVALYDTYGDKVEFNNLCGYEAGVFDQNSGVYPKAIPGGGDEYITSLHNRVLERLPNVKPDTEHGLPGIYAQVLDELPFILPDDYSYNSAFFTVVLEEGEFLDPLPAESNLMIRFRVPDSLDPDEELAILWWDGMEWVDLGGEYSEDGYYFQITTDHIGVFVLAVMEVDD
jgi:hypothetical protein